MGVRQHFEINKLGWKITIYYTVTEELKTEVTELLKLMGCKESAMEVIALNLEEAVIDTGFAYSNYAKKCSIIVLHKASSIGEFINTFEHEKNHLEMHICEALDIDPYSEEAAHLSGDLALFILEDALYSIIEL